MRIPLTTILLSLAALTCIGRAADPTTDIFPDYTLTPPQPTQLKSTTILYETIHAVPSESAAALKAAVLDLYDHLKAANLTPTGGPIFIFKGVKNDNTPIDIQVAVPLSAAPATVPAGCEVRELASIPSVTALFKGKFADLQRAYPDFFRQAMQLNKRPVPAGELRQRTLYYESETSENNVVMIEVQTAE